MIRKRRRLALVYNRKLSGISTREGIMSAHNEPPYHYQSEDLENTDAIENWVVLLPLFHKLMESKIEKIGWCIKNA